MQNIAIWDAIWRKGAALAQQARDAQGVTGIIDKEALASRNNDGED